MPSLKSIIKNLSILIVILTVFAYWSEKYDQAFNGEYLNGSFSQESGSCNIVDIKLRGNLATYAIEGESDVSASSDIVQAIEDAEQNDSLKAILLEIDSPGGYPVAGEEIANALKKAQKPTVAVIRQSGTSAAYWAATGADRIFASSLSDVGGIGVTMSYLDNAGKNAKDGLTYNSLSAGIYKDAGDPEKSLTAEEKALFERDIKISYERFVSQVAKNRHLDIEKVKILADGSTMMGDMALTNGLIDQVGGVFEVEKYLNEIIGSGITICQA